MVTVGVLLFLISLLGGGTAIVLFLLSFIRKNRQRRKLSLKILAGMAVLFVASIVIVAMGGDTTPPEITVSDADLGYGQTISVYELALATDENSGIVDVLIETVSPESAVLSEDFTSVTFPLPGDYTVTISATDESGNEATAEAAVHVTDGISPVFTGFAEQLEVGYGETVKLSDQESEGVIYAVAEDEISDTAVYISNVQPVSQDLSAVSYSMTSDSVVFSDIGEYVVTVTAQDESGNDTSEAVSVSVIDEIPPDFSGIRSEYDLTEDDEAPDFLESVTAIDEIDGDLTEEIALDDANVEYGVPGEYTVTYFVTDSSGNVAEKSAAVIVQDTTPPVISPTKTSYSVTAGSEALDFASAVSVTDAVDGDLADSVVIDDSTVDYDTPGTYEVTYSISDSSGNVTEKTASVTVKAKQTQTASVSGGASASTSSSETVYITNTGSKYHRGSCRYLKKSKIAISKADAIAQGYDACSVCNP
ncbi:MAG: DUF5011 domain-containing protein [Lachnospiraceae bacterium]|nr:DUF5011 domain-containing protein [Lachnospiraceae bacterium]